MSQEKKALKKKVVDVPKDRMELEVFMVAIRQREDAINAINVKANAQIAELTARINAIKKNAQDESKPFEKKINELAEGVLIFAQVHRVVLTDNERRKTVEFTTGDKIRWYLTPPAVVVRDEEKAKKELKRRGLPEFIRVKEEIDKEEILKQPEKIKVLKWLSVSQAEIFAIVLAAMGIELQKGKRKFKKVKV